MNFSNRLGTMQTRAATINSVAKAGGHLRVSLSPWTAIANPQFRCGVPSVRLTPHTGETNLLKAAASVVIGVFLALLAAVAAVSATADESPRWVRNHRQGTITTTTLTPQSVQPSSAPNGMRAIADPIYGVTVDDGINGVSETSPSIVGIVNSAKAMAAANRGRLPTHRFVFDENTHASDYLAATKIAQPYTYIMGELLDSYYVKQVSVQSYSDRAREFVGTLGDYVDVWEIGNEVNGEWLGDAGTVSAKISAAYDVVKAAGKRSAITLYYNPDCWDNPANEMFTWTQANVPAAIRSGVDYVLLSYYEGDCNNYRPSASDMNNVFNKVHTMFPSAKLGFGEVGLSKAVSGDTLSRAQDLLTYYYGLSSSISTPGYVGGYFWWYYYEDMLPYAPSQPKPMWSTLVSALTKY